jgi:hypothetical protein
MTDNVKKKRKQVGGVRAKPMTEEKWKRLLELTANGMTRREAVKEVALSYQTYSAYLLAEPGAATDIRAADRAWYRRDWPIERIEPFLLMVAQGNTNVDAAAELNWMEGELEQLMQVILHDKDTRTMYDEARKLQAESWADEMIQIADDATSDYYTATDRQGNEYQKVDHEVVNRSRLRIGTRQWLMSRLHHERFGDRIHQQIEGELNVNHADMLDLARKRKEKAVKQRDEMVTHATQEEQDPDQYTVH